MGIGNYRGTIADKVMFFTTKDGGFDVDISEFVKANEQKPFGRRQILSNYWSATVTFKDYSYVLETDHFNINMIAEKIQQDLINIKHPEFAYKIDNWYSKLGATYFDETHHKFGYALKSDKTVYNPVKDEFISYYSFNTIPIAYVHKGSIDDYIPGDFLKFIISKSIKNEYEVSAGTDNRAEKLLNNLTSKLTTNKLTAGKAFYRLDTDDYYQLINVGNRKTEKFITPSLATIQMSDLKDFLKETLPEYMV